MKRSSIIILGIILFVSSWLRLSSISTNPPSLSWDEVSIGYNAYSILTHGVDEHGVRFPLGAFAGFGDYKPSLPIYLAVPFVALFGLSELAVRLPSAIFGIFTVLLVYFLVKELFDDEKMAFVSAFFLSISPWHIMLSRAGFEANIATFFITLGIYLLLVSKSNASVLPFSLLPFVAGMYTFNSARYAGPLIAFGTLLFSWSALRKKKKEILYGLIVAALFLLPLMPHLFSKQSKLRFYEVSIFTDIGTVLTSNARSLADGNAWWSKIVHNRRLGYAREYLIHFVDNLEPRFLFIKGDGNPKFSIQDSGQLLLVTAPLIFLGWLTLFARKPRVGGLLLFWLLSSIAPAAVARETPHALRIENGLLVWIIITAYGFKAVLLQVAKEQTRYMLGCIIVFLMLVNFGYFWHTYTTHYRQEYSGEWQYGYREAIQYAESVKENYDTIVLSESIGRPYMYALFYGKYDLLYFRQTLDASFDAEGFYNVYGFGKYRFVRYFNKVDAGRVLYILPLSQVPENAYVHKNILLLNGVTSLVIFEL